MASNLWLLLGLEPERTKLASIRSVKEVMEIILKASEYKKMLMIIALWYTWSERNRIREEGKRRTPEFLASCVELYVKENAAQTPNTAGTQLRQNARWKKLPEKYLKLNCDAAFYQETGAGSWGAIIRDSDGDVVSSGRGRINHLFSAFQAEIIACLQGIQLAVSLGIGRIIIEIDAKEVELAINSRSYNNSVCGHLIDEIKSIMDSNFLKCVFIPRDCNRVAHELTALGYLCIEGDEVVMDFLPDCVSVMVANDLLADQ